jgi:hypothetical protein
MLGRAWKWTKANLAVPAAFAVGLGLGAALGGVGFGGRSIVWGTAGEWISGAATFGAVMWAVWAFQSERNDRLRVHATSVTVSEPHWVVYYVREDGTHRAYVTIQVGNDGPAAITNVVVYVEVDGRVEWAKAGLVRTTEQWDATVGTFGDYASPPDHIDSTVTVVFRDVEQRWWQMGVGGPPTPRRHAPPEVAERFPSSRHRAEAGS